MRPNGTWIKCSNCANMIYKRPSDFKGLNTFCSKKCYKQFLPKRHPSVRFWPKVKKTKTCWNWIGVRSKYGYGIFYIYGRWKKGVSCLAHRFSWELKNGAIEEGMLILHHCDNTSCVRPSHLFKGTQLQNIRDCIKKGRFKYPDINKRWKR